MRIFFLLIPTLLFSVAKPGFFNGFKNRHFVETGSYEGEGIDKALSAGFEEIHSIEISEEYYLQCKEKFKKSPNVHLFLGDSATVLEDVIREIVEPITFWLDGHFSGGGTGRGETNTPILGELEAIRRHPVKTHTILIDDVRLFGTSEFDEIPLQAILDKIYEINPRYRISFATGYQARDILIAVLE